jgi:hypothetical protein
MGAKWSFVVNHQLTYARRHQGQMRMPYFVECGHLLTLMTLYVWKLASMQISNNTFIGPYQGR